MRYASHVSKTVEDDDFDQQGSGTLGDILDFNGGEARLVLASRDYFVLYRDESSSSSTTTEVMEEEYDEEENGEEEGTGEEGGDKNSEHLVSLLKSGTRVESNVDESGGGWKVYTVVGGSAKSSERRYNLVSETGEYFESVPEGKLRGRDVSLRDLSAPSERAERRVRETRPTGIIKRQWSALTDAQHMRPIELDKARKDVNIGKSRPRAMSVGGVEFGLQRVECERPPALEVKFSLNAKMPQLDVGDGGMTLFNALQTMEEGNPKKGSRCTKGQLNRACDVLYEVVLDEEEEGGAAVGRDGRGKGTGPKGGLTPPRIRERGTDRGIGSIEGINETCVSCLEVLGIVAEEVGGEEDSWMFVSKGLMDKLLEQLEDPLAVVSGALPEWCRVIPVAVPRLFTHDARMTLLERGTFGVSRAVFRQQENKVDVAGLRSRMEAIRQRAIGLMQEAFSEDAEDPMALQLQADELYTLEESLKAQVEREFKKQRWAEHWLQSAKGTVRRECLLDDANVVMENYFSSAKGRRRRLEIQFEGESGFDASSGEQAGVTRGFYGDVVGEMLKVKNGMWIGDLGGAGGEVVIPTPRAGERSTPGLFPKPMGDDYKDYKQVLGRFRLLGRICASALRDGFLVPIPLSLEFLKLVQDWKGEGAEGGAGGGAEGGMECSASSNEAMEDAFGEEGGEGLGGECLPRVGFLGGEISGIDECIVLGTMGGDDKSFGKKALNVNYDLSFNEFAGTPRREHTYARTHLRPQHLTLAPLRGPGVRRSLRRDTGEGGGARCGREGAAADDREREGVRRGLQGVHLAGRREGTGRCVQGRR